MSRAHRFLVIAFALLCGALPSRAAQDAAPERHTAIIDPATLRELDSGRFRLDRMLSPERAADIPLANDTLFALPSMAPVRQVIDGEFYRYVAWHDANLPKETIGVGEGFDFQLFDRALLYSRETRFVLAGIVNRMDRAYVDEAACGEIRLIYRLTRINKAVGDNAPSPRLPMTLHLVLRARSQGSPIRCAGSARRGRAAPAGGGAAGGGGPRERSGGE